MQSASRPRLYALHDDPKKQQAGSFEVTADEAGRLNSQGYGVFWVVNEVEGVRKISNLKRIRYWYAELDDGTKQQQLRRIRQSPLLPSLVVESKRGYHCYWRAADATLENWNQVVRYGLVPALKGDPKASDPVRLLRAPGYQHVKNPQDPWPVAIVWEQEGSYREEQMLRAFPSREPARAERGAPSPLPPGEGTLWQRAARLDGREAIRRLSGHWLCNGERFSLREISSGTANIIRELDGYSTGCWVWSDGRLGGVDGGGTIAAWARWYGHDWPTVARGLKEVFPELRDED